MAIPEEVGRELAQKLIEAPDGPARRKIVREYALCLGGRSEQCLYSIARQYGWKSGRKSEKIGRRIAVTDKELGQVSKIIHECRVKGKAIMPTWRAIQIAEDSGFIPRGILKPEYFNKWFREQGFSRADPDSRRRMNHVRMATLHPNHVHLFDVTNCAQWYLAKDGKLGTQTHKEVYRNKEGKNPKGPKVLRFAMIDHYSSAFYVRYFLTDGEGAEVTRDFLIEAWREKTDPAQYPFHGVPLIMYSDKGPGNKSTLVQSMCKALDVNWITHTKEHPWAKGAIEGFMAYWERVFESGLRINPVETIEDLNARAYDMAVHLNAIRPHKRHGGNRFGLWVTIKPEQLRILPGDEILDTLIKTRAEKRVVRPDLMIKFGADIYRVPDPNLNGARVDVCYDPYSKDGIIVTAGDRTLKLTAVGTGDAGYPAGAPVFGEEFKSAPQPEGTKKQKALSKEEWKARPVVFGEGLKRLGAVGYIKPKGTPIDVVPLVREIPRITAMKMIIKKLERGLTPAENRHIHAHYQHTIPEPDIKTLVDRFRGGLDLDGAEGVQSMIG